MPESIFDLFDDGFSRRGVATDPVTLDSMSSVEDEQDFLVERTKRMSEVELRVDYSDFSNFVFFNSAYNYFNIAGEKVLNEYPFAGSRGDLEKYVGSLDGYQKHVLDVWPKRVGHLRLDPTQATSYVEVIDSGYDLGEFRTSLLSPGSSSFSIEGWFQAPVITGPDDVAVLVHKSGSVSGSYSVYLTGSLIEFAIDSAATFAGTNTPPRVSCSFSPDTPQFFSCVCDRGNVTGSLAIYVGGSSSFPVLGASSSLTIWDRIDAGSSSFLIGSGTISSKVTVPFTGSIDDVRFWKKARTLSELSASFNTKTYAQKHLYGLWRFNESGSLPAGSADNSIVLDHSGHRLNGTIYGYFSGIHGSGTLMLSEDPDPILVYGAPEVNVYVAEQQASASLFDRSNENCITKMFPEDFFNLEEVLGTEVLRSFLFVIGRFYDDVKLKIDHLQNIFRVNYGKYDQVPDQLMDVMAKFFGWKFSGNFLDADAFQYLLGRNVLKNVSANRDLDVKLFEIKNRFWRRLLNNLVYLYKTKGTPESVRALLRTHGVDGRFVRLKEYGYASDRTLSTQRISAAKTNYALAFGSGSSSGASLVQTLAWSVPSWTVECHLRFPTTASVGLTGSLEQGNVWMTNQNGAGRRLYWARAAAGSVTGTLWVQGDVGCSVVVPSIPIFDDRWYHVAVIRNAVSGTFGCEVRRCEDGEIVTMYSGSQADKFVAVTSTSQFKLAPLAPLYGEEHWAKEVRVWRRALNSRELDDHALDFHSYGLSDPKAVSGDLLLHWKLNENVSASDAGAAAVIDSSNYRRTGVVSTGFTVSENPYKKTSDEYNYIASPDFGWTDDKVRVFDSNRIRADQVVRDTPVLALEFNMVDALNEDVSQIIDSMEALNDAIGSPVGRYREEYQDLAAIRAAYFKRLTGRLNFNAFVDMLDFFDRSFVDMIAKMVPARALFVGDEIVVESHMLERPKIVYGYFPDQEKPVDITGSLTLWKRYSTAPRFI